MPFTSLKYRFCHEKGLTGVTEPTNQSYALGVSKLIEVSKIFAKYNITTLAWTWRQFPTQYSQILANNKLGEIADVETYTIENDVPWIKSTWNIFKGKAEFYLCTKPTGWDGDQKWLEIVNYCTALCPMLYIGDYNKSISDLANFVKTWSPKLGGKLWAILETYNRDGDYTHKTSTALLNEINAVWNYVKGVAPIS